jgi:hypothetical protein
VRVGGGQDRHVIQMIANAGLDVIEDVMRKENMMCVWPTKGSWAPCNNNNMAGI